MTEIENNNNKNILYNKVNVRKKICNIMMNNNHIKINLNKKLNNKNYHMINQTEIYNNDIKDKKMYLFAKLTNYSLENNNKLSIKNRK